MIPDPCCPIVLRVLESLLQKHHNLAHLPCKYSQPLPMYKLFKSLKLVSMHSVL